MRELNKLNEKVDGFLSFGAFFTVCLPFVKDYGYLRTQCQYSEDLPKMPKAIQSFDSYYYNFLNRLWREKIYLHCQHQHFLETFKLHKSATQKFDHFSIFSLFSYCFIMLADLGASQILNFLCSNFGILIHFLRTQECQWSRNLQSLCNLMI